MKFNQRELEVSIIKNIMILDSDIDMNKIVSQRILSSKFNVISTYNLQEARKILCEKNIDMIILDTDLADGSGISLCKELRDKSDISIIFLSKRKREEDVVNGFKAGADDYFIKPFDKTFTLNVLCQRIDTLFNSIEIRK